MQKRVQIYRYETQYERTASERSFAHRQHAHYLPDGEKLKATGTPTRKWRQPTLDNPSDLYRYIIEAQRSLEGEFPGASRK